MILAFNILHLLRDPKEVLQRIHELLKPGGLFISETACMGQKKSFLSILLYFLCKIRLVPFTNFLQFSELENLIAEEKFQVVESREISDDFLKLFIVVNKY